MMQRFVFAISVLLLFTLKVSAQNFADSKLIEDSEKEVVKQILTNARVGTISNDSVSAITLSKRVLEGSENTVRFISRERRDHALFFVVKDYDNWKNLEYPIDDAEKIAVLLKDKYNFDTTIIYSPIMGRMFYGGFRIKIQ